MISAPWYNDMVGTWAYVGGTGRYEGVQGEGTCQGRQHGNGTSVSDREGTQVLPD